MQRCLMAMLIALAPMLLFPPLTIAAEVAAYNCQNSGLVRRVVIEADNAQAGVPCEVVYWKDNEQPGVRSVLWNARSDAAFCAGKASGLVDTLTGSGWVCTASGETQEVRAPEAQAPAAPAASPQPTPAPAAQAALPTTGSTASPQVDAAATPSTAAPSTPAPSAQPPERTVATVSPEASPAPEATTTPPNAAGLNTVIAENLASLNQSVDGDFEAEIGDFGDLNKDGFDDAVVFFNYQSSSSDYTQFVAAYLFNGQNYHLAATKPVGGDDRSVKKVEIEDIVDGSIFLTQEVGSGTDITNRRTAMVLQDGQLVENQ